MQKMYNNKVLGAMIRALAPQVVPSAESERMIALDTVMGFAYNFMVPMRVPQDVEAQRKNFVFSALYRLYFKVQTYEVSQRWDNGQPTKFCKVKFGIDTIYGGFVHDQLIKARLLRIGANKLRDSHGSAVNVNNSTLDFVMITWKGIGKLDSPVRRVAQKMVREFWVIENDHCKLGATVVYRSRKGNLVSLNGIVEELDDPHLLAWLEDGSARHYVYFIDSPSGYRQGMMPAFRIPFEHEQGWKAWMEEVLDVATAGQYSVMKEARGSNKGRIDKMIKDVGRLALGITPSTFFGYLENFAIYCGDLKSPVIKTKYDWAEGIEFEYHYETDSKMVAGDGNAMQAVQYTQATATARFGYPISKEDAIKFGGQQRKNGFGKGVDQIVERYAIIMAMLFGEKHGKIKAFIKLEKTREDSIRFEKLKNVPYEEGGFQDCVVYFGDLDKVEWFADLTCVKCATDFSRPIEVRLMDISHTPHGYIPLSKQGIIQMQLTGDEFLKMDKAVTPAAMDRIFRQVEFDDVDEVVYDIDEYGNDVRTSLDLGQNIYSATAIQTLCPRALEYDVQIKRIILQSIVDTINKRLNRFNLTTEGYYLKLVPDFGRFFDVKLLEDGEFYAPSVRPMKDDTGFDAVIIRYPLVDFGAFIKGRAVSKAELIDRIKACDLSYGYIKAMLYMLESITSGMGMIASMVPGTTDKLSGADFDGDGGCFFTATAVKTVYTKIKSYSNNYGGSCTTGLELEFNYDLGPISFLYAWALESDDRKPNASIGMIAGLNVTVSSMLAELLAGKRKPEEIMHWLLDRFDIDPETHKPVLIKAEPGSFRYHRLFTTDGSDNLGVDVSFAGLEAVYADKFVHYVSISDWSFESVVRILWDFNAVLSKCMNDTIDAAKNGAIVFVPFLEVLTERVRSSAVAVVDYAKITISRSDLKFAGANNGFQAPCMGADSVKAREKNKNFTLLVDDPVGLMKKRIFTLAYNRVKAALVDNVESDLTEYSAGDYLDKSLDLMASFYNDLMKVDANDKALAKRMVIAMTYAMLRRCKITNPERILGLVLHASNYTKSSKGALPRYNSFYIQFNEIIRHYVAKLCPDTMFTLPVYKFGGGYAYVGQTVTFEDGRSKDGFYVEGKVNGTFTLEPNEKFQPVIKRRALDMIPEREGEPGIAVFKLWKQFFKGKDLSPKYDPDGLIGFIENKRDKENLWCEVRAYDPEQKAYVNMPTTTEEAKQIVFQLVTNYGPIGFLQTTKGLSTAYMDMIIGKRFSIENIMKMGSDKQTTVCVLGREIMDMNATSVAAA